MSVEPSASPRDREPPRRTPHLSAVTGVRRPGQRDGRALRGGRTRLRGLLGEARPRADRLVEAVRDDPRVGPAVREVVHGRGAQRRLQLRRSARGARARRQGGLPLDRRAGRHPHADLRRPEARGLEGRERAQGARRREGRPCRDLHADDPGAADRDARLRADRRPAHGRLRRLLRRVAVRADQRLRREGPDHGRRRLPARQQGQPEACTPTRPSPTARRSRACSSSTASGTASTWFRGRDHWWHDLVDRQSEDCPPVPGRLGAHALPALHRAGRPPSRRASCTRPPATSSARRTPTR